MPENAEVALTGEMLSGYAKCYLLHVEVVGGRYTRKELPGLKTTLAHLPCRLARVKTHGKFLWMEFDELFTHRASQSKGKRMYLLNTLGLEGRWSHTKIKHSAVKFWFYDPTVNEIRTLWWADQRNFGTLAFTQDREILDKKLSKLAPDLLLSKHNMREIWRRYCKAKESKKWAGKPIVELLMDQLAVVSGIGNYLSAEILYAAKLAPATVVKTVDEKTFRRLYEAMCTVVASSYYGNKTRYVDHLGELVPKRTPLKNYKEEDSDFEFRVYQQKEVDGEKVIRERILSTRASLTYWCPSVQK